MTAQPTTRISTSSPQGPQGQPPFGPPQQPPAYGAPQQQGPFYGPPQQQPGFGTPPGPPPAYGSGYPAPFTPPPAPPASSGRNVGKIIGLVAAVVVVLAAIGVGAVILFGSRTVDPASVQSEIVRITQTAVQVAPTNVHCPEKIKAQAGGTFVCTATVDSQPVNYNVRQDDDKGHLTITYDRLIKVADLQSTVADKVRKDYDVPVNVACEPAGRTVAVNAPGTPIACTATNASDPTDSVKITVTVAADGTPSYTVA